MPVADKITDFISRSSWIRKMFEEGTALKKERGEDKIFDFTLGNPTTEPPQQLHDELRNLATQQQPGMHRYMNNAGYDETRAAVAQAIAGRSAAAIDAHHIVMTCGAGAAINVVLKTLLNPGDEVLILTPYFVEYKFYIDNHNGIAVEVVTTDDFQPDLQAIESAITSRTKAIIINSPNNPTGVVYPEETLKALAQLLKSKEQEFQTTIVAISDEPYARISFDAEVPCILDCIDNSLIVTSHSKDLALPGERIGYIAANPRLKDVDSFMNGAIFCNRVLGFVNAPALMQRLVASLQNVSVDIEQYRSKRDLLFNKLTELGFSVVKPQGGFYLFPESPLEDEMEFIRVAQKHGILLVPGSGFGTPGYFRIAYCVEQDMIERSLPVWADLAREVGLTR